MWGKKCVILPFLSPATVAEDRVFSIVLGNFLHDVELKNITFSTELLAVKECNSRGYTIQEHWFPNKTKSFSLHVPFDADVVLKRVWKFVWEHLHCFAFVVVIDMSAESRRAAHGVHSSSDLWSAHHA